MLMRLNPLTHLLQPTQPQCQLVQTQRYTPVGLGVVLHVRRSSRPIQWRVSASKRWSELPCTLPIQWGVPSGTIMSKVKYWAMLQEEENYPAS